MTNLSCDVPVHSIVAEFDILGFKEIISNPPINMGLKQIADSYEMYFTRNVYGSKGNLQYKPNFQIFSDTVVIYKRYMDWYGQYFPNHKRKIYDFFRHLCIINLNSMLAFQDNEFFANRMSEFPIRGGISTGEIIIKDVDCNAPVLMGKPIIEAYEWEQQQNWLGLSINPNSIETIKNILQENDMDDNSNEADNYWNKLINENILVKYNVPTKIGLVKTWVINFVPQDKSDILTKELDKALKKYIKKPSVYAKYYATKEFVNYVVEKNRTISRTLLQNDFSNI